MSLRFFVYIFSTALFCSLPGPVLAATPVADVSRMPASGELSITSSAVILKNAQPHWSIDAVASATYAPLFQQITHPRLNFGFARHVHWFRFKLKNSGEHLLPVVLETGSPLVDAMDLYVPRPDGGGFDRIRGGELTLPEERGIVSRNPAFLLKLAPQTDATFYLQFRDEGAAPFSLTLWTPEAFASQAARQNFFLGAYYGSVAVMALYSLLIFFFLRLGNYLYYALYVGSYLLWQSAYNGVASLYLLPAAPWVVRAALPILPPLISTIIIVFAQRFLKTAENSPRLHRLMTLLAIGNLAILPIYFAFGYTASAICTGILVLFMVTLLVVTSFSCWKNGYRPARYFTIAWMPLLGGTALLCLKEFGVLPSTFFTEYAIQIGSFLEIVLLSLALLDQFNIMRLENQVIQQEMLELERSAKSDLEQKVRERTMELSSITSKISKYLPPQLSRVLLSGKDAGSRGGNRQHLSVFFSDIVGFTELTDSLEPDRLSTLLNEYLDVMAGIALAHGGTIDKYMGDAILIFFGAPESRGEADDARSCIRMALEMRRQLGALRQKWHREHDLKRPVAVRFGIHSGYSTVGSFGSIDRLEYTVIGGNVNTAKRLEEAAAPDQILISQTTRSLVGDDFIYQSRGLLELKGLAYPIRAWAIAGASGDDLGAPRINETGEGYEVSIEPSLLDDVEKERVARILEELAAGLRRDGGGAETAA